MRLAVLGIALAGCGRWGFDAGRDAAAGDGAPPDGVTTTTSGAWSPPAALASPVETGTEQEPSFTDDRLTLVFRRGFADLYQAERASPADNWSAPRALDELNSAFDDVGPGVSGDGLTLYFVSSRGGNYDIFVSTRVARDAPWSPPTALPAPVNSPSTEFGPAIARDGTFLFTSERDGTLDLWQTRQLDATTWAPPVKLSVCNDVDDEGSGRLYANGRGLVFHSNSDGNFDLWESLRSTTQEDFPPAHKVAELSSLTTDWDPWIAEDGHTLMWSSDATGTMLLYQASR